MSIKNKLFKEMFKMSSAAAQQASMTGPIAQAQLLDPAQPNPPKNSKISTQPDPTRPMDNSGVNNSGKL